MGYAGAWQAQVVTPERPVLPVPESRDSDENRTTATSPNRMVSPPAQYDMSISGAWDDYSYNQGTWHVTPPDRYAPDPDLLPRSRDIYRDRSADTNSDTAALKERSMDTDVSDTLHYRADTTTATSTLLPDVAYVRGTGRPDQNLHSRVARFSFFRFNRDRYTGRQVRDERPQLRNPGKVTVDIPANPGRPGASVYAALQKFLNQSPRNPNGSSHVTPEAPTEADDFTAPGSGAPGYEPDVVVHLG